MPRIPDTNNAQSYFLRTFRSSPAGPPPEKWPAAATLRRWLRRPGFRRALQSLEQTLRFRADFLLATAATHAVDLLPAGADALANDPKRFLELLRLLHVRQRFTTATPTGNGPDPANDGHAPPAKRTVPFFEGVPGLADELLQNPSRLKAYMQLTNSAGDHKFDDFLRGFADCAELDLDPPHPGHPSHAPTP